MAAQRKFINQIEQEKRLKNFIHNLSDDSVNEYLFDSDDSNLFCVFPKIMSMF